MYRGCLFCHSCSLSEPFILSGRKSVLVYHLSLSCCSLPQHFTGTERRIYRTYSIRTWRFMIASQTIQWPSRLSFPFLQDYACSFHHYTYWCDCFYLITSTCRVRSEGGTKCEYVFDYDSTCVACGWCNCVFVHLGGKRKKPLSVSTAN